MDNWQIAIVGGLAAFATYCIIRSGLERRRQERIIRKLFAYVYQTKDCLVHLSALQDHAQEVQKRLSSIDREDLERIEKGLVKRSMALSILSYLNMEHGFDCIRNRPFVNVALNWKDRAAINSILEAAFGPDCRKHEMDLNDETMSPILEVLKEFTDAVKQAEGRAGKPDQSNN